MSEILIAEAHREQVAREQLRLEWLQGEVARQHSELMRRQAELLSFLHDTYGTPDDGAGMEIAVAERGVIVVQDAAEPDPAGLPIIGDERIIPFTVGDVE